MLRAYGDSTVYGASYGDGPVRVLWLHGWARRAQDFDAAAHDLARLGVASVAFDLPGFGASPPPVIAGGARHYAQLILPAVEDVADEPLVIVGHSFGGPIATVLASTHPHLVRALVLVGAPVLRSAGTRRAPRAYRAARWLGERGLISAARLEASRQHYGSSDYRNAHGVMREVVVASVNETYEEELRRVVAPVFFVWGEGDREVPLSVAERSGELVAGRSRLTVLPGVGHLVPLENPGALVDAAQDALSS